MVVVVGGSGVRVDIETDVDVRRWFYSAVFVTADIVFDIVVALLSDTQGY